MTVEVERRAVFRQRAWRSAAQRACDVEVEDVAAAGDELAEEGREIGLRLGVGDDVQLFAVEPAEKMRPAVAIGGRAVDQKRAAEDDDLASIRGQPLQRFGNLAFEARAALGQVRYRGGNITDIARRIGVRDAVHPEARQ